MDIAALSVVMKNADLTQNVSLAVTKKAMDVSEGNAQDLIKMMELSVNPNLGSTLDIKV